ncbi:MAG TPA: deoxyribonuclease IV [Planctomycetaceae bacterium]|nr:deoxyribonuclease IV [Planctomycetaceae bacterium]
MPLLGAHMSIAGGYYKAVEAAAALGMDTVQLFTKNNNQWNAKPITDEDIRLFRDAMKASGLRKPCAHNSYLINLASPKDDLWRKSLDAMIVEVERAEALGLDGIVMHPGSFVESDELTGLGRIATAIDEIHQSTKGVHTELWLETTAGQGTNLGHRFEHLAAILGAVGEPERLGVCVDSCHIFAAGYPLQSPDEYQATMVEFDRVIGRNRIRAWHLNDSKKPLGSRVDRHEHIGEGCLGLEPFRHILNDPVFHKIPMYLETEKCERDGEAMDAINLRVLRGLIATT